MPLEREIDPSFDDNSAFRVACANGYIEIVRLLFELPLERGIVANDNALQLARENGHAKIVSLLLEVLDVELV